jgi:hypothetical protein
MHAYQHDPLAGRRGFELVAVFPEALLAPEAADGLSASNDRVKQIRQGETIHTFV